MTTETSVASSVVSLSGNGLSYAARHDDYRRKIINTQGESVVVECYHNHFSHPCNFFIAGNLGEFHCVKIHDNTPTIHLLELVHTCFINHLNERFNFHLNPLGELKKFFFFGKNTMREFTMHWFIISLFRYLICNENASALSKRKVSVIPVDSSIALQAVQ